MLAAKSWIWWPLTISIASVSATSWPLTTITPCPAGPSLSATPIIVTSQYQPVSTCESVTACHRHRCSTAYSFNTYAYVSTVIPCSYKPSYVSTVTRTEQSVLVSRSIATVTNTRLSTRVTVAHGTPTTSTLTQTDYTTISKEWSARYKDLGRLAIPDYPGSGICTDCDGPEGPSQLLDVVECRNRPRGSLRCKHSLEKWVLGAAPVSSKVIGHCSTATAVPTAGTYTFAFPQRCSPYTFRAAARTITVTMGGDRPSVSTRTIQATTTVFPGQDWTAFVTRSCRGPTRFNFGIDATKTIIYRLPPFTVDGSV